MPFNCYITSAYLTPNFGNIEVIYEGGVYRYKWKVTAVGEQTINFKTNTNNAAKTVFIDADLFQRGQVSYLNTNGVYRFSNVVLTPNPVDYDKARSYLTAAQQAGLAEAGQNLEEIDKKRENIGLIQEAERSAIRRNQAP